MSMKGLIFYEFLSMGEKEIKFYLLNTRNHSQTHYLETPTTIINEINKMQTLQSSNYAKNINPKYRINETNFVFVFFSKHNETNKKKIL